MTICARGAGIWRHYSKVSQVTIWLTTPQIKMYGFFKKAYVMFLTQYDMYQKKRALFKNSRVRLH